MINLKRAVAGLAVLVGFGMAGCAGTAPETSGELLDRLSSAEQIKADDPRQASLALVARDAADNGDAAICLEAMNGITETKLRDRTAEACAASFNSNGQRDKAELLVTKISSADARDKIREGYAAHPAPMKSL